jgi:hypothetical protein
MQQCHHILSAKDCLPQAKPYDFFQADRGGEFAHTFGLQAA